MFYNWTRKIISSRYVMSCDTRVRLFVSKIIFFYQSLKRAGSELRNESPKMNFFYQGAENFMKGLLCQLARVWNNGNNREKVIKRVKIVQITNSAHFFCLSVPQFWRLDQTPLIFKFRVKGLTLNICIFNNFFFQKSIFGIS